MSPKIKRTLIYARCARYSIDKIEHQINKCIEKAQTLGYELAEVIIDMGSASINKPKFQKLLHLIQHDNIHSVICLDRSRLSRDVGDNFIISNLLKESDVELHFANSLETSANEDHAMLSIISLVLQHLDNQNRINKM